MKSWAMGIILLSLFGKLVLYFLPKGEKSPLFPPIKFLLSLCLIASLFFPLSKVFSAKNGFSLPEEIASETENTVDANALILERMGKTIKKSVDTAFPKTDFTLEIFADESGIPTRIKVIGGDGEGIKIAEFIERNYGLETVAE